MFITVLSPSSERGANTTGSPRAICSSIGSDTDCPLAFPILRRHRVLAGTAGDDGVDGTSMIGDAIDAAAMARAISLFTADNLKVDVGSHTPLGGRVARLGQKEPARVWASPRPFGSVQVPSQRHAP